MSSIFPEISIKNFIEKMNVGDMKKELNEYDPEHYAQEDLNKPGYFSNEELREELLQIKSEKVNEEILRRIIDDLSIVDVKKRLQEKHYWYDFESFDDKNLRKELFDNEALNDKNFCTQKSAELAIKKYGEYLNKLNISDEIKQRMLLNLSENLHVVKMEYLSTGFKGAYIPNDKALKIRKFGQNVEYGDAIDETDLRDIWAHEMTHAATVSKVERDLDDMCEHDRSDYATTSKDNRRVGFQYMEIGGTALNEGMTEYFSNKLLEKNGHKSFVIYPMYVLVVKDLVNLYGEEEIFHAFVKSPEHLEQLMEKDGKCFVEFMELLDESYIEIYNPKEIKENDTIVDTIKSKSAQKKWNKVGKFIEDIKQKRMKETPGLVLGESNWKEAEEFTESTMEDFFKYSKQVLDTEKSSKKVLVSENEKKIDDVVSNDSSSLAAQILPNEGKKTNKIIEWFKSIKDKIVNKFKKEDKPLLLSAGEEIQPEPQKKNEFLESLKVKEEDLIHNSEVLKENEPKREIERNEDIYAK